MESDGSISIPYNIAGGHSLSSSLSTLHFLLSNICLEQCHSFLSRIHYPDVLSFTFASVRPIFL